MAILVSVLPATHSLAQEKKPVLEGTWKGTLLQQEAFIVPEFVISMEFTQKGEKVSGKYRSEVRGKPMHFAEMSFTGTLKGRKLTFQAQKFLVRKPLPQGRIWVLPAGKLTLSADDAALEGPWTGAKGAARRLAKGIMIVRNPAKMVLKVEDLKRAAKRLDLDPGFIVAVGQVESAGRGFLPSGLPKVRFDAHEFSRLTSQKYDLSHGSISSKKRNPSLYKEGEQEYDRLAAAMQLDKTAALEATAWGRFQILGIHHKSCGYDTVEEFVRAMHESELKQLEAFLAYLKNKGLDKLLREKRWEDFARAWYGEDFDSKKYAKQLEEAYNKHVKELDREDRR
jgi:hypothetical protein